MAAPKLKVVFLDDGEIRIDGVRGKHLHVFEAWAGKKKAGETKEPTKKFSLKAFMTKENGGIEEIKKLKNHIEQFSKDNFKGVVLPADKLCLRTGKGSGDADLENGWVLSASENNKPTILGRGNKPATNDGTIYSGCYLSIIIKLWDQSNEWGKRVNANLLVVRYMGPAPAFSDNNGINEDEAKKRYADLDDEMEEIEGDEAGGDGLDDDDI